MKPVIYFDGTNVTERFLWEVPDAFLVNEAYTGLDILSITEDDLPRAASDSVTLIHGLFSLLGKSVPPELGAKPVVGKELEEQYKVILDGLATSDQILMELKDMSVGLSDISTIVQEFTGADIEEKFKSLFRMLQNVAFDMSIRIDTVTNYVEAATISMSKMAQ